MKRKQRRRRRRGENDGHSGDIGHTTRRRGGRRIKKGKRRGRRIPNHNFGFRF